MKFLCHFLHHRVVYIMFNVCNIIFENKNNLLVKKQTEKQDSKPAYGFFRFTVINTSDVTSGTV